MNTSPLISVIIPVYNGSNFLSDAIQSVLNQSYSNYEILVVNDGSTDNGKTREVAQLFADKIRYFEKENGGVSTALNYGIKNMHGTLFAWLSHDDTFHPDRLNEHIVLRNHLKLGDDVITYNDYQRINAKGELLSYINVFDQPNILARALTYSFPVNLCSALIPLRIVQSVGLFCQMNQIVSDTTFLVDAAARFNFVRVPLVLTYVRWHDQQGTHVIKDMRSQTSLSFIYALNSYVSNYKVEQKDLLEISFILAWKGYKAAALHAFSIYKKMKSSGFIFLPFCLVITILQFKKIKLLAHSIKKMFLYM